MAGQFLPLSERWLTVGGREELRYFVKDVGDSIRRQGDGSTIDVDPKTDDFEDFTVLLLLIIVRAGDTIPKQEKLNLSFWAQFPVEPDEIVGEIPPKEIVHVDVESDDVEFPNPNPTDQP